MSQEHYSLLDLMSVVSQSHGADGDIRASSRENLSSGFATRLDTNQSAQLQKLVRGLKLRI